MKKLSSKEGVSFDEVIENIDIGGPALLRAAAKNHSRVTSVCSPDDYQDIVSQLKTSGNVPLDKRRVLAAKSFRHVSLYDEKIAGYLGSFDRSDDLQFPSEKKINLKRKKRYFATERTPTKELLSTRLISQTPKVWLTVDSWRGSNSLIII